MKKLLVIFLVFQALVLNAQYSLNGGLSTLKAFGESRPYVGFHLGGEFPRDNETTFYLKAAFYAKNKLDPTLYGSTVFQLTPVDINNSEMSVEADSYFNYTTFDGGLRYYLLDGYDSGFALYGGTNVMGMINKAKYKLADYDINAYRLPVGTSLGGSILNLGFGFSGGAKYTISGVGSVYFDLALDYLVVSIPGNAAAQSIAGYFYSPIVFSFNLGFRKDFY